MAKETLQDPRKHVKTLKENLEVMGIDWSDKTTAASDRANLRRNVDQCSARNWGN